MHTYGGHAFINLLKKLPYIMQMQTLTSSLAPGNQGLFILTSKTKS